MRFIAPLCLLLLSVAPVLAAEQPLPTPEPATFALLAGVGAAFGLKWVASRRKK